MIEVDEANAASTLRLQRLHRGIEKMRLERAFLLEQLAKRTSTKADDSEGSPSPPPTVRDPLISYLQGLFLRDSGPPKGIDQYYIMKRARASPFLDEDEDDKQGQVGQITCRKAEEEAVPKEPRLFQDGDAL